MSKISNSPNLKILIIRFSSIGDIVLCSPVIRLLKNKGNVELHFLTKFKYKDVLAFNPHIDRLYLFEGNLRDQIKILKKEKFDLIIDLHHNFRTFRIKQALKVKSKSFFKANIEKWLMVNFKIDRLPKKHIVDRYVDCLSSLKISNDGQGLEHYYRLDPDLFEEIGLNEKYIVFALGAAHKTKQIPFGILEKIVRGLEKHKIVLIGGNDVEQEGRALKYKFPEILNFCGKVDLHASSQIIDKATCVVSGDSGMMHIAAALKKNLVSIWGNTIPAFGMSPYYGELSNLSTINEVDLNCRPCSKTGYKSCPKKHFKCMQDQDTDKIIEHIQKILA